MLFPAPDLQVPSAVAALLEKIPLPRVAPVSQVFDRPRVENMEAEVASRLRESGCLAALKKGQSVAVTAGSRGITDLPLVIRTVVRAVRAAGAEPFVVPAMGSHGGATAEGQIALLQGLGIDEESVEAPLRSSMDTVVVGTTANGLPAHMDRHAAGADGIIAVNRIKPHTSFRGEIESGVLKMLTIGLGKQRGAEICHNLGFGHMAANVPAIAEIVLAAKNVLCGVGIVENALHETALVEILRPETMLEREKALLREAWSLAPKIFFDSLDVLIIDEIGKDISGTGFDCNVAGRYNNPCARGGPEITRVAVLDITDRSKGNGNGIGMADVATRRAFAKFSAEQTYPNALTSTALLSVKMPMVLVNDSLAIRAALKTCNVADLAAVRLVRIKNTNELRSIFASEALLGYCRGHPNLRVEGDAAPFAFNAEGNLW
ncbi:MAG: DUF362 domain-containing protein [Deltaproteobacteria bacterium]|jgi:hypothetical protein|nr:DUF362 domain-containing protein [Deltaproteobacteria bacterium]